MMEQGTGFGGQEAPRRSKACQRRQQQQYAEAK